MQLELAALTLERGVVLEGVRTVGDDLLDLDHQRLARRGAADGDQPCGLLEHGWTRHVVDRLKAFGAVDTDGAVVFEDDDAVARGQACGESPRVADRAAGDEYPHG